MNARARARWERARAKGRLSFILRVGLLQWPLAMIVGSTAVRYLAGWPLWDDLVVGLLTWMVVGLAFASYLWNRNERWRGETAV